ncbi:DUF2075 domain-containing protein [Luteitalea pratensis]|uniref:DUF2075 domain-containing protein n=1 Tax=Luteitalea pratensis TaxID=1855912 RepID=UPI001F43BDEF|nr:DUF2075 domain-containing protein [Luteitalea pratensis]
MRGTSAYYSASVQAFLATPFDEVIGRLTMADPHRALESTQKLAWAEELQLLREALSGLDVEAALFLEFDVPRLGSRIDAVVIAGPVVIPVEFKCGEKVFTTAGYNQAWDYGLDLKNFHLASHKAPIFPVLVATRARSGDAGWETPHVDGVRPPRKVAPRELRQAIADALRDANGPVIDADSWGRSPYQPTPTIVEAARALYSRHSVQAITRNDAGAKNLQITSGTVEEIIERSRENREKAIIYVTGVPGAGKTLVGLNVATQRRDFGETRAVFLSGNGPLVAVLQEALTRDEYRRQNGAMRKGAIRQQVKPFIQNVHHFRDDGVRDPAAPGDHVVIFDEAQRAWNREKTADFMKRRKGRADFDQSESEFLISYLDRHDAWAVIVCLVGGGQEIHTGEAGISAWLDAVARRFPHWRTYLSPDLSASEYGAGTSIAEMSASGHLVQDQRLHLSTSMRSFRSEKVSAFVKALLDCDEEGARDMLREVVARYPVIATRDLALAKQWIRDQARGSEQYGLVASSQALRLKPHAIDVRVSVDPIHWFLGDPEDTRSSYYLEDAATEFQVQGLEVDWACVTWDADLRRIDGQWRYHAFRGDAWTNVKQRDRQRYLLNAYRVLLTRARQGMVIFVPPGDRRDPTRLPGFYDETFGYLRDVGVPVL